MMTVLIQICRGDPKEETALGGFERGESGKLCRLTAW